MFNMFHQKWLRLNVWALLQTSLDQKGFIMFLLSNVQYNCIRCYMMMLHVPSNAPRSIFLLSHADIHSHVRLDPMGLSWKFHEGSMTETCGSHGVILRMLQWKYGWNAWIPWSYLESHGVNSSEILDRKQKLLEKTVEFRCDSFDKMAIVNIS